MPREYIGTDGVIRFRTKLLEQAQAERFAACLCANTRFVEVDVTHSDKAKTAACFFVSFRPANADRQTAQADRQQARRTDRALNEGAAYIFAADVDGPVPFYWTFNPYSGETYQTTDRTCTCPDFLYRCGPAGLLCKHIERYRLAVKAGDLMPIADLWHTPEAVQSRQRNERRAVAGRAA